MVTIDWYHVALVWLAMALHAVWCIRFDKTIARDWLTASLRSAVQLGLLGFALAFLMQRNQWAWTASAVGVMLAASTWTAVGRAKVRYPHLLRDCAISLGLSVAGAVLILAVCLPDPKALNQAGFFIPLLGILLGNSLSGLSLGLAQWLRELQARRSEIEFWLAIGATRDEAVARLRASALRTSMTAVMNSMSVAGIVSIPGMMSGQLLAGGDVQSAVHYQLVVLFLISAVVFGASTIAFHLSTRHIFDRWGALAEGAFQ